MVFGEVLDYSGLDVFSPSPCELYVYTSFSCMGAASSELD